MKITPLSLHESVAEVKLEISKWPGKTFNIQLQYDKLHTSETASVFNFDT